MEEWDYEDEADGYPLRVTRTPMVAGGMSVMEAVQREKPSIFRPPGNFGEPRVHLPKENPKYPETKHTVKKVIHNISVYSITQRVGSESYDPVMLGGNSVRRVRSTTLPTAIYFTCNQMESLVDHYPYAACTPKEVVCNPIKLKQEMARVKPAHSNLEVR